MEFKKSTRKNAKYMVVTPNGKTIHFGDKRYHQFKDTTGLGLYSDQNHNDVKRQQAYAARHKSSPINDKESPAHYSWVYLWDLKI